MLGTATKSNKLFWAYFDSNKECKEAESIRNVVDRCRANGNNANLKAFKQIEKITKFIKTNISSFSFEDLMYECKPNFASVLANNKVAYVNQYHSYLVKIIDKLGDLRIEDALTSIELIFFEN